MLERLEAAIDQVEVPATGDALIEAFRILERLAAKLSEAVNTFEAGGGKGKQPVARVAPVNDHDAGSTVDDDPWETTTDGPKLDRVD